MRSLAAVSLILFFSNAEVADILTSWKVRGFSNTATEAADDDAVFESLRELEDDVDFSELGGLPKQAKPTLAPEEEEEEEAVHKQSGSEGKRFSEDGNDEDGDDPSKKANGTEPILVTVFYDSLCPFSRYFMYTSLWNVLKWVPDSYLAKSQIKSEQHMWRSFNVYGLQLELVPFGNSRWDEKGNMICQHGEKECSLNLMHSCILKEIGGKKAMNATVCTIYHNAESFSSITKKCLPPDQQASIEPCLSNGEVVNEVVERVWESDHEWVPWVEINGKYNENARWHLMAEICKNKKPAQILPPFCIPAILSKSKF